MTSIVQYGDDDAEYDFVKDDDDYIRYSSSIFYEFIEGGLVRFMLFERQRMYDTKVEYTLHVSDLEEDTRCKWMANTHVDSPSLFPSKESSSGFLSDNTIRQIKKVVEDDIGVEFELRQCRRTFGQRNLDRGLDIESASVLMGHATTNTTERFYSRMKLEKAQKNLKQIWESTAVNGEHAQEEDF